MILLVRSSCRKSECLISIQMKNRPFQICYISSQQTDLWLGGWGDSQKPAFFFFKMRSETLISKFFIWVDSLPYFTCEMPVTVLAMPGIIFIRNVLVRRGLSHWHSLVIMDMIFKTTWGIWTHNVLPPLILPTLLSLSFTEVLCLLRGSILQTQNAVPGTL